MEKDADRACFYSVPYSCPGGSRKQRVVLLSDTAEASANGGAPHQLCLYTADVLLCNMLFLFAKLLIVPSFLRIDKTRKILSRYFFLFSKKIN